LDGNLLQVTAAATTTIKELKTMVLLKRRTSGEPLKEKILKATIITEKLLTNDQETLESAGLLHKNTSLTAIRLVD